MKRGTHSSSRSILNPNDVSRIYSLAYGSRPDSRSRNNRLSGLKKLSNDRLKNWGNTLEAMRDKVEQEKEDMKKKQMEELKKIDDAERKHNEEIRKAAISRATKLSYENTDEFKSVLSGMMISDVLHERENQARVRQKNAKLEELREKRFLHILAESQKASEKKERLAIQQRRLKEKEIQKIQISQLDDFRERYCTEREREAREGLEIKRQAQLESEEAIEKAKQKAEYIRLTKLKMAEENRKLEIMKRKELEKIAKEDEKIAEFARKKELQMNKRQQIQTERHRRKLEARQQMIDRRVAELELIKSTEDDRVASYIAEAESKAEQRLRSEREQQMEQRRMIDECRQRQLHDLNQRREEERNEAVRIQKQWAQDTTEYEEKRKLEKRLARKKAIDLNSFHRKQMVEKREREFAEKQTMKDFVCSQVNDYKALALSLKEHADKSVAKYAEEGRDIRPVYVALRNSRII